MKRPSDTPAQPLKIPSDIKYIREVSSKILKSLEPYKVGADTLFDIRLCVEETVRNAIVHGNRNDKKSFVKIGYRLEGGNKFSIEIEDEGEGFNYRKVPDPTEQENLMKSSGRGIYLTLHLMDKVQFNDKGNKVTLIKYLS